MEVNTLAEVVSKLEARGFRRPLFAEAGKLLDRTTREVFEPGELAVDEVIRLEGETDPDEQLIAFAVRARDGPLGVYVVPFGAATPLPDVEVVRKLRLRAGNEPPATGEKGTA